MDFPGDEVVKNLPSMQEMEMWARSLGQEGPWRKKWQVTAVILLGTTHRQRSLAVVLEVTKSWTWQKQLSTHMHWMYMHLTDKILFRLLREFLYSLTISWSESLRCLLCWNLEPSHQTWSEGVGTPIFPSSVGCQCWNQDLSTQGRGEGARSPTFQGDGVRTQVFSLSVRKGARTLTVPPKVGWRCWNADFPNLIRGTGC